MKKFYMTIALGAIFVMGFGYGAEWHRKKSTHLVLEEDNYIPEETEGDDDKTPKPEKPEVFNKKPPNESDNNEKIRYNDMTLAYRETNVNKDSLIDSDQIGYEEELEVEARERGAFYTKTGYSDKPYMIEETRLGDAGYPVVELYYFEEEDVVSTGEGYLVEDHKKMIGDKTDVFMMNLVPKSESIFIRNTVLERDYEVRAMEIPYAEFMKTSINNRRLAGR